MGCYRGIRAKSVRTEPVCAFVPSLLCASHSAGAPPATGCTRFALLHDRRSFGGPLAAFLKCAFHSARGLAAWLV